MLILKEPIQLVSARPFLMASEAFPQRLIGNYEIAGADFTAKELFYLLSSQAELPEDMGGMTMLVSNNRATSNSTVTMQVVNNLLNRIMLLDTPQFTYQDNVYITTVLSMLGVTDIKQFISEARQVLNETRSVQSLLRYYREDRRMLREHIRTTTIAGKDSGAKPAERDDEQYALQERCFLQKDIFRRLQTENIYHSLSAYAQNSALFSDISLHRSLMFAEQLHQGNVLALNRERCEVIRQLLPVEGGQTDNAYERGELREQPRTETEIYAQAATAAMLSAAQHLAVQSISVHLRKGDVWLDLSHSLAETVENSFRRYELYHNAAQAPITASGATVQLQSEMLLRELKLFEEFHKERQNTRTELRTVIRREGDGLFSETDAAHSRELKPVEARHLPAHTESNETDEIRLAEQIRELEQIHHQREQRVPQGLEAESGPQGTDDGIRLERGEPRTADERERAEMPLLQLTPPEQETDEIRLAVQIRELEQVREQLVLQGPEAESRPRGTENDIRLEHREPRTADEREQAEISLFQLTPPEREVEEAVRLVEQIQQLEKEHQKQIQPHLQLPDAGRSPREAGGDIRLERRGFVRKADEPEVTLASPEQPPAAAELEAEHSVRLVEQIRLIDRQNRERIEQLREQSGLGEQLRPATGPDMKKTKEDALRAMNAPEQALMQLLQADDENQGVTPRFAPEVELLLSKTDETTRELLKTVMLREQGIETPQTAQMLHSGSEGQLNSEVTRQQRAFDELLLAEAEPKIQRMSEMTGGAKELEQIIRRETSRQTVSEATEQTRSLLHLVHKAEPELIGEEMLEQLARRQTVIQQQSDLISETKVVNSLHTNDFSNQVVTQTTEDINELVRRTIARQMDTITGKVYQQMEKRLQLERHRRGR